MPPSRRLLRESPKKGELMAKSKFKARAFKKWLDILAKVCVKTRDNFTCQIGRPGCSGKMDMLDRNCQWCHIKSRSSNNTRWLPVNALTGCGHCHQWEHANPAEFGVWFKRKYLDDYKFLNRPRPTKTWREDDFRFVEAELLQFARELKVDPMAVPETYRKRFIKASEE